VLGVVGAVVGGFLFNLVGASGVDGFPFKVSTRAARKRPSIASLVRELSCAPGMTNAQDSVIEFPLGAPQAGEIFAGKYRIERVLGVGGMGYVLAATHVQLDERVAIKLVLPELARDGNTVQRFVRERRAAVKVRSEHVGKVLDVALHDSTPYMVMDYPDGCDLAQLLEKRGRLPVPLAVDYVLQVCEAVAEAHAMKTVHRDLKPANMFLIRRPNGTDCVKALDFGISKVTTLKSSRDVNERSDIWALGVILYEIVFGKPPFNAQSLPELGAMVLSGSPPYLQHAVPECPVGFADVIATCLRKDPIDRFTSLADFADAVAPFGSPAALGSVERIVAVLGVPTARASLGSLHSNPLVSTNPNRSGPFPALAGTGPRSWGTGSHSGPHPGLSGANGAAPKTAWRASGVAAVSFGGVVALGFAGLALLSARARDLPPAVVAPPATRATESIPSIPASVAAIAVPTPTTAVPAARTSTVIATPRASVPPTPHTTRPPQPRASTTPPPAPSANPAGGFSGSRFD
jgi:serine/threonine protein kinase